MKNLIDNLFNRATKKQPPRVFIVSFPRSGHHAMLGFLNKISDFAKNYCEFYNCKRHNGEEVNCFKSNLNWRLKNFNCGAGNRIIKNHDFDLTLPYNKKDKFIVQFRHPFHSINSWYELEKKDGKKLKPKALFFKEKLSFWKKFIDKWVVSYGDNVNVMLVPYESLSDPLKIQKIAKFANAEIINLNKLGENHFKPKRELEDPNGFYATEEFKIATLLSRVSIPMLFNHNSNKTRTEL